MVKAPVAAISWAVVSLVRWSWAVQVGWLSACFHDAGPALRDGSSSGGGGGATTSTGADTGVDPTTTTTTVVEVSSSGEVDASSGGVDASSSGDSSSGGCVATAWYGDKDKDGHGDAADVVQACAQPADHVAVGDDCDDTDAQRSPTVIELCDDKDNDCDALVDEYSAMNPSCEGCTLYARGASSYAFCLAAHSWDAARGECGLRGGDLLVIDDADENDAVAGQLSQVMGSLGQWYMGANDRAVEGSFVWLDGPAIGYTRWSPGEPNDYQENEDCAVLFDAGDWNDEACAMPKPFVCES